MPKVKQTILSLDTEDTGLDLFLGARPFLVTFCDSAGVNTWYEWTVNPETRDVQAVLEDLRDIQKLISGANPLVLQNSKFDYQALRLLFEDYDLELKWDWGKVRDTLLAGHLLASNQPHDLTSMVLIELGVNIQSYEDALEAAAKESRVWAKRSHPNWALAKAGRTDMPSAKESTWKYDTWLCKWHRPGSRVCADYANSDSASTLALWKRQEERLKRLGLWRIYEERLKLLPIVAGMEARGITLSKPRLAELEDRLLNEANECHCTCVDLSGGTIESLPVNGSSNAVKDVLFKRFKLVSPKSTPKGQPSTDKY